MSIKIFNKIPVERPRHNGFNLSHSKVLSFDLGELVPIFVTDVIPGDRFNASHETLVRFSPLVYPVMHMFNVYVHSFFVPNRLIWTSSDDDDDTHFGWEAFITGGEDGTLDPTFPMITVDSIARVQKGTIADYMGVPAVPSLTTDPISFNSLPFRAYRMIWNEYYRNQNVQDPLDIVKTHVGTDWAKHLSNPGGTQGPLMVNNERDYLTSALPWLQRGSEVNLPVEGQIAFVPDYKDPATANTTGAPTAMMIDASGNIEKSGSDDIIIQNLDNKNYDLTNVSITINELRNAQALQRWLEANARGGARYKEQILSLFGVITSDARLDRPEYLGGGKSPMIISEVLATAETSTTTDVGDMKGHGISVGKSNRWSRRFEEHGFVITLMFVRPKPAYYQGLPRMFWKNDRYDYFFPHFENIGEQEIYNGEAFFDGSGTLDPDGIFGYAPRYAEYKHINDSVHGEFKDNLDKWHLARTLDNTVALNSSFVECDPDDRIFAVTTYDNIYAQVYNQIYASRPMQQYGIPKLR